MTEHTFSFRLGEQDADIIAYLLAQPNASQAIRDALRAVVEGQPTHADLMRAIERIGAVEVRREQNEDAAASGGLDAMLDMFATQ